MTGEACRLCTSFSAYTQRIKVLNQGSKALIPRQHGVAGTSQHLDSREQGASAEDAAALTNTLSEGSCTPARSG